VMEYWSIGVAGQTKKERYKTSQPPFGCLDLFPTLQHSISPILHFFR
jgi:hypothetical protein